MTFGFFGNFDFRAILFQKLKLKMRKNSIKLMKKKNKGCRKNIFLVQCYNKTTVIENKNSY